MTQQFKAGDRVTVVEANAELTQGQTYTVSGHFYRHRKDLVTLEGKTDGFYNYRFVLADEKPEVGDTVEVTTKRGTVIRGVVTKVGLHGLFFEHSIYYVTKDDTESLTIIEKAKKPKVWAVGDVVEGGDYASETIKDGTLVGTQNDSVIKRGDKWIDCQTAAKYAPIQLAAERTIAFIP